MKRKLFHAAIAVAISAAPVLAAGNIQITEWMYDGVNQEFVEFTNVGDAAIDLTGWSYDDNSGIAGSFSLSGFGVVSAGESVILAESSAAAFRTAWNVSSGIKVIGGSVENLGRSDAINIYNNSSVLVDTLTYNDQASLGLRTQLKSSSIPEANLALTTATNSWPLSAVNDGWGTHASSGADLANPGSYFKITGSTNLTVTSNRVLATGVTLAGGTSVVVQSGATLSNLANTTVTPLQLNTTAYTLTNAGTILAAVESSASAVNSTVNGTTIDNSGTIHALGTGRAVFVDASLVLTNTGTIEAAANHAVRAKSLTLLNAGTIRAHDGNDGINLSSGSATSTLTNSGNIIGGDDGIKVDGNLILTNQLGGSVTSGNTAVSIDGNVTVTNFGLIEGNDDSGVSGDSDGTVDNHGTIRGKGLGNADGDGVDIDLHATIHNWGTIEATHATIGEGITIGEGTVENYAGAHIIGGMFAIHVVGLTPGDTPPTPALGSATILNQGDITSTSDTAIYLRGTFGDTVTNSGNITGGNGVALFTGGGDDHVALTGGTITGDIDLGDDNDTLEISGGGVIGQLKGGNGTDTLRYTGGAALTSLANASGFEEVTVGSTAALSPGGTGTVDTLTIDANLTLESGATLMFDLGSSDLVTGNGSNTLTLGSDLTLELNLLHPLDQHEYLLFENFSSIIAPGGVNWNLIGAPEGAFVTIGDHSVSLIIPEPSAFGLLGVAAIALLRRRR